ncbi:hypothetical protein V2S84_05555 [Azotobacter chroococcum]|nr:hypothetical protein [Azotobacter chroococcum]
MTARPTYHAERLKTDKDGRLTSVQVKGTQNVDVKGYLAAWVPDTQAQE